jgi:hypothetical protein
MPLLLPPALPLLLPPSVLAAAATAQLRSPGSLCLALLVVLDV